MKPFEKWLLWISTALVGATGVAYFWVKYFMEPAQPWDVVAHPIEPWLLRAHIVTAPLLVFAIGLVTTNHIWKHFRSGTRAGRASGLTAMVVGGPMVVTGYLIQVITHPGWLRAMAIAHIVTSLVFLLGFVLHGKVFRRTRRRGVKRRDVDAGASSPTPRTSTSR
ncbi:MAG: hypothetical protein RQ745_13505 [Longimicrobiales bacterium]|nr:hypothetical protein [Longimicrobiales bacterium]